MTAGEVADGAGAIIARAAERTRCAVCDGTAFDSLLTLERVPVYMGCTDADPSTDAFADQIWCTCSRCGAPQLRFLPPLDLVYAGQHNVALGGVWERHHHALVRFLGVSPGERVVEIGGSTGALARIALEEGRAAAWTVVEPNPTFVPGGGIHLVEAFIEDVPDVLDSADLIVHSHVLEHLYEPRAFLATVAQGSAPEARMVLSVPNLPEVLNLSGSNALNFEHTYYFGLPELLWMLGDAGFVVEAFQRFEDHSLHVRARRRGDAQESTAPADASHGARALHAFVDAARRDAETLATRAAAYQGDIYLFGGHVFSQFLLVCGFPAGLVSGVLDNDRAKQGRRLYGTSLIVESPELLRNRSGAAVVVRAAHYTPEVTAQLRDIAPDVDIW